MATNKTAILISAKDNASKVFGRVARSSTKAQKKVFGVNSAFKTTDNTVGKLSGSVKALTTGLVGLAGVSALAGLVKESIAVKIEFDKIRNTLKAVTGSSKGAGKELGFLTAEAERLGLELVPLANSYSRLAASSRLLGISTKESREIFTSFSEAIAGFGLGKQDSIGVFTAIEQILSKGKVSSEELRQQLGERLPGAMQLAAKSMGVTTSELDKMLKAGQVLSKDFILPFARAVRQEFGGAAVEGAKLLNAQFNRSINVLDQLKLSFIEGGAAGESLSDSIAAILKELNEFLSKEENLKAVADFGRALGDGLTIAATAAKTIASALSSIPAQVLASAGLFSLLNRGKAGASIGGALGAGSSAFTNVEGVSSRLGGFKSAGAYGLQESILGKQREKDGSFGAALRTGPRAIAGNLRGQARKSAFAGALKTGPRAITKNLASTGGKAILALNGLIGPLGLLATAALGAGLVLNQFKKARDEETAARKSSEASGVLTQAFLEIGRRKKAGQKVGTGDVDEILAAANAKLPAEEYALITDKIRKKVKDQIVALQEVPKAIIKFIDPLIKLRDVFTKGTADILGNAKNVATLGSAKAKELENFKKIQAALEKDNFTKKEAIRLTKERIAAQNKLNKAQATDAFKNTIRNIKRNTQINDISGTEKEAIALRRLTELFDKFKAEGFDAKEAASRAKEQKKVEDDNLDSAKKFQKGTATSAGTAVGEATRAKSIQAGLKRQQRREDQKAAELKRIAESTDAAINEIAATMRELNLSTI